MSAANQFEWQMRALINAERAAIGANPLKLELTLNTAAEDHSQWMLTEDEFSHTGVNASDPGDRMDAAGFEFSGGYGWAENLAGRTINGGEGYSDEGVSLH